MSRLLALTLICCLLLQSTARLSVIGYYELNKAYIAKNLCENRDKPRLKCCGKCCLRRQLARVEDNAGSSKNGTQKVEKAEAQDYILPARICFAVPPFFQRAMLRNPRLQRMFDTAADRAVFRPPGCFA